MDTVIVTFEPDGALAGVAHGTTVLEAARAAGVRVAAPCGGAGLCAGCAVLVQGQLTPPTRDERRLLSADQLARGMRLACRARVTGPVVVRPLGASGAVETLSAAPVTVAGYVVDPPGARGLACTGRALGVAIDLGTTTIEASIVDLRNGDSVTAASVANPQAAWGADVMSRVSHAMAGGSVALREAVADALSALLASMLEEAGAQAHDICEAALAGNTVMTHLLLGQDVSPLASAPYQGAHLEATVRDLASVGIRGAGDADLYVLPAASAFLGGDVVAGLVATRFEEGGGVALFIDLGTNGEIVLRTPEGLLATSAAAGPAFEGGAASSGMRAEPGAIWRVGWDGEELRLDTIGDAAPRGLCGSGLLALVASLLDAGVIAPDGRMSPHGALGARVEEREGQLVFRVSEGVALTQGDVRAFQLALAAVRAGVERLLAVGGLEKDAVGEVVLAGALGAALDEASLQRVGMLPSDWRPRVRVVGNAAHAGTAAALVSSAARAKAASVARVVRTHDLAMDPGFRDVFIGSMTFPAG